MGGGLVSCYLGMGLGGFGWKCIVWYLGVKGMIGQLLGVSGGIRHGYSGRTVVQLG